MHMIRKFWVAARGTGLTKPLPDSITTKPLAGGATGGFPKVEVAIYAAKSPDEEAIRVFHYKPATPDARVTQPFTVE